MSGPVDKEADLEKLLAERGELAVLFYSAWCPFCTAFLPAFEKHGARRPDSFARALTDGMPAAEDRYLIEVVPTIILFRGGKPAARLDGILGRGITETMLSDFLKAAGFAA